MANEESIAKALLEINAVGFPKEPITFKSGILSPVYIDNRKLIFYPESWKIVINGLSDLLKKEADDTEVVAGVETAGIPHSSVLGLTQKIPSVFIRKTAKDHGTKKMVEGGEVKGKKVLLLEDHVSTALSSLHGVKVLKEEGASIDLCFSITSYGWTEALEGFAKEGVRLLTLCPFPLILDVAFSQKVFNRKQKKLIEEWISDPHGWGKKHGYE